MLQRRPLLLLQILQKAARCGRLRRQGIEFAEIPNTLLFFEVMKKSSRKPFFPAGPDQHVQAIGISAAISHQVKLDQ